MTLRHSIFAVVLVATLVAMGCSKKANEEAAINQKMTAEVSGEASSNKHKFANAMTVIPNLSIDITNAGGNKCSISPQHPTISTSDQNQVYWHADDLTTAYQVNLSWNCPTGGNGNTTITLPANTALGDSIPFNPQSCGADYQAIYSVSMKVEGAFQKCSPDGAYIGIHITQ